MNRRQARENACDQDAIGFDFVSDWLRRWYEIFKPITERSISKTKATPDYFRHSIENKHSSSERDIILSVTQVACVTDRIISLSYFYQA